LIPFEIKDCALLVSMSGIPAAYNLRELRDRFAMCSPDVLYYHFFQTPLAPAFDNPDYRNDFAAWVKLFLGDRVLAERLGIIDPYEFPSIEELRGHLLDLVDERLSELPSVLWTAPGSEFYFLEATTIAFDTGDRVLHPRDLAPVIQRMTNSSVYFHFLEARRRPPRQEDDFTAWLRENGGDIEPYIQALASIDFYFYSLSELRQELVRVLLKAEEPA
jgi:hypothetical protein